MRRGLERAAVPLALVTGAVVFALLCFELLLRAIGYSAPLWGEPHGELGWRLRPGIEGRHTSEGDAQFKTNASGWRDRDHPVEKPDGVYRIAVLGDSYSEARQVPVNAAFWALLPNRLQSCGFQPGSRIEVLNFSVSGYGTAQEYLVLRSVAIRYKPDLVLLQFTNGNDVRNNSYALSEEREKPFFRLTGDGNLYLDASFSHSPAFRKRVSRAAALMRTAADHSRLLQMLRAVRHHGLLHRVPAEAAPGIERGLEPAVLRPPTDAQWEEAWTVTEMLIAKMRDYVISHGAQFVVVTVPYAIQVHPDVAVRRAVTDSLKLQDLFYPDRRIAEFAARNGIAALALAPEMQRVAEKTGAYLHGFPNSGMGRGHWNSDGHRLAADLIAKFLCSEEETVARATVDRSSPVNFSAMKPARPSKRALGAE